jgi:hypothetical protein
VSKVDALRALREAKYARMTAPTAPKASAAPARPAARVASSDAPVPADGTCGHRNMSGRECTREADHVKTGTKNHRYG